MNDKNRDGDGFDLVTIHRGVCDISMIIRRDRTLIADLTSASTAFQLRTAAALISTQFQPGIWYGQLACFVVDAVDCADRRNRDTFYCRGGWRAR